MGRTSAPQRCKSIGTRRPYIDWARGVAVLIMIEAHTLDAWTRAADRQSPAFRNLTILGGFAAPLFLWLAGLGVAFAATRAAERTGSRARAATASFERGIEIFLLAFLFRLQAFVLSPGSPPIALLRVDILNVMGPALAATAVLWGLAGSPRRTTVLCSIAAATIAMTTPLVRAAAWVDALPTGLQWYLRPAGLHTNFTLFPWAGFVLAGAAAGSVIQLAGEADLERRVISWMASSGAALVALGVYTAALPSIYREASFWTSSPTYFAVRVGVMMLTLGVLFALTRAARAWSAPFAVLERFGRHSLFVYWIHVELVYGYATWPIHGRLPLWGTALAYAAFCSAMYWAITLRRRMAGRWRPGGASAAPLGPHPVSA